jgi:hypothetical protein
VINSFIVLIDKNNKAVRAKTRSCYLINSSALVVFCEKPAVRIDYDTRHDVLYVTTSVDEKQRTEVGKTARRMALSGVAAGLLRGGPHPGLAGVGGALLDYRIAGTEKRTIFTGLVHVVFRDFSTVDILCDRSEFAQLCSVLPQEAFSSERAERANEQFSTIRRMATEGPRVLTELTKNISDLKEEINAAANACEHGARFKERDEARSKLEQMKEQLSIQQASLQTVRYLIESGAAA